MSFRGLVLWSLLCCALLLSACGGGSGRQGSDVVVTGVGPSAQLNGGDVANFVMTVSNAGSYAVADVVIKNAVSQMPQSSLVITCSASGDVACPSPTGSTMTVPSLPAGASLVFHVSGPSVLGASGNVSDTMSASVGSGDTDTSNNTATAYGAVVSNDVGVTATPPAGPLLDGPATFTMVVANAGPNDATNVSLATSTSANVTLRPQDVSCVANANTGGVASPQASVPTLQADGTLLSPLIPATGGLTCSVNVTVAQATNGFAVVTMQATALGDSRVGNNAGTASVSATLVNDLGVVVTAPAGPLLTSAATFNAVISNAGPSTATGVTFTNTTSSSLSLAGPISCAATGGAALPVLQPDGVTWLSASIPANGSLNCSIPTAVTEGTNGLVSDTVSLSITDDPRTVNNSSQAAVQATLVNNVSVAGNAAPLTVPGASTQSLTFSVGNSGPGTAYNVALSNTLSGAIAYSNTSNPVQCSGGSVPPATFSLSGLTATSTVPVIAVGDVLTCSVPVAVNPAANGTVASTLSAVAPYDTLNINNSATVSTVATSADVGVSQTAASTVAAGTAATFSVVVANPRGQGPANNMTLTWTASAPSGVTFAAPTCVALGGGVCPSAVLPNVANAVPTLLNGASLLFTFTATSANVADRGAIVNNVTVSSDGDTNSTNNTTTATTQVVNPANGSYSVFAADGRPYSLSIDFGNPTQGQGASYTMSGNGLSNTHAFTLDPGGTGDYVANDNAKVRLRIAQDLIVGSHDFAGGVQPFVAARSFVGNVAQIAGSYNLATRVVPSAGAASTHAATALISGNTLSVCQSETVDVSTVGNCAPADLTTYTLSVSNNVFSGLSSGNDTFPFYVANSGAAKVLLSASPISGGSQQLRVGLIDFQGGLTYGGLRGPSVAPNAAADWLSVALDAGGGAPTYAASSVLGLGTNDTANLLAINTAGRGPFSMLKGASTAYSGQIYLMQSNPLTLVFGSSSFGGAGASGMLVIGLP